MKKRFLLMGAAAVLVMATVVGGSLAASQVSGTQAVEANLQTKELQISMNGGSEAEPALLSTSFNANALMPGDTLDFTDESNLPDGFENFTVTNTRNVPAYVRVTVDTYWLNDSVGLVGTGLTLTGNSKWIESDNSSLFDLGDGDIRQVFYYTKPLQPGESTDDLLESLELDFDTVDEDYAGMDIAIDAYAEGVQYADGHDDVNADGILSSWGVTAALEGGNITAITQ